ncbi:hypothetical protein Btru_032271 [Bulinus truncatus]|nr:hypothetical protein Btru_032271 [Bulinus truncatus]
MQGAPSDEGCEEVQINSISKGTVENSTISEVLFSQEELSECLSSKKHKNKKRKNIDQSCEEDQVNTISEGILENSNNSEVLLAQKELSECQSLKKHKKKKRKKSINECSEESDKNVSTGSSDKMTKAVRSHLSNEQTEACKSKKHKKKKKSENFTESCEETGLSKATGEFKDDFTNGTKKKKKSKVDVESDTTASHHLESILASTKTHSKHKNKSKNLNESVSNDVVDDQNSKKRKKTKELPTAVDNENESQEISINETGRKSKKHNKQEYDNQLDDKCKPKKIKPLPEMISKNACDEESCNGDNNSEQSKTKKSSDLAQSLCKEKKKKRQEIPSEKSLANQSESVSVNSAKSAQNSAAGEEVSADSTSVQGQWKGHLFNNEERQSKFLRLMGGMKKDPNGQSNVKKGLYGSLASLCKAPESKGNVAMSTVAADELNKKLEDEYNKALNFKISGKVGTGFGFTPDPAEGKKFHIDINKTKSIKFDD